MRSRRSVLTTCHITGRVIMIVGVSIVTNQMEENGGCGRSVVDSIQTLVLRTTFSFTSDVTN